VERRDKILKKWLTGVMPLVDPVLGPSGLTFRNAAVDAGVAAAPASYQMAWYAFDNATGAHRKIRDTVSAASGQAAALPSELANQQFVMVAVWAEGANPNWRKPARVYFKRDGSGWKLVGLERDHAELPRQ
jgi:hypothetical protein